MGAHYNHLAHDNEGLHKSRGDSNETHNIGFYEEAILMSTHNIGFYEKVILISTHKIGFYEDLKEKKIFQLSNSIKYAPYVFFWRCKFSK